MDILLLFILLFICLACSLPIGVCMGISTVVTMLLTSNIPTTIVAQDAFTGLNSFPLLAIPLFILAGNLMTSGGISKRILNFALSLVGFISGGLAMVTTVACMFFAAISGSAPATVSAIGSFMMPAMVERGYDEGFAGAITAAAGSIGVIIPPSIPFVIYAVATGASVSELFEAGIIPGLLVGVALMIASYFIAKKNGWKGTGEKFSFRKLGRTFVDSFWALLSPVIILGGIYKGVFTPTEAAVVGVVYSLIVGLFVYKELKWSNIYSAMVDTVLISGATTFMIGLSTSFAHFLTMQQVPVRIGTFVLGLSSNFVVVMLLINATLLVVGCFMDNISATVILAPIFLPIVQQLGMTDVQFGIVMTMNLAIGFVTPPYGTNLFVASSIGGIKLEKIVKNALPLIFAMLVVLMLTTFIPGLSMCIPNLLAK